MRVWSKIIRVEKSFSLDVIFMDEVGIGPHLFETSQDEPVVRSRRQSLNGLELHIPGSPVPFRSRKGKARTLQPAGIGCGIPRP